MEPSNFSETQFVVGYLREYLDRSKHFWLNNFIRMPSTTTERATGADLIFKKKSVKGSHFLQFKRSDYLLNKRGLRNPQNIIHKSFFPCYRFKIYNDTGSEQFDTLRKLARRPNNHCAYVAPMFHTYSEFDNYLALKQVVLNSAIIEINQFNIAQFRHSIFTLRPDEVHYLLFHIPDDDCWFCSEPIKVKKEKGFALKETFSNSTETRFEEELSLLIVFLKEVQYPYFEIRNRFFWKKAQLIAQTLYFKHNIIWVPNFTN